MPNLSMQSGPMKKQIEKEHLDTRIKICIQCGNDKVEFYEHGVSCESCGTSLYFGIAEA